MAKSKRKQIQDMTPPERLVRDIEERYPTAWRSIEAFRADPPTPWPVWCYVPIAATMAIVTAGAGPAEARAMLFDERIHDPARMAAAAAWRATKSIYRFDPDLASELIRQDLDGVIPVDVLYRLPEWCVYVELPPGCEYAGFLAHLEHDVNTGKPELRFIFAGDGFKTMPLILKDTLATSTAALIESARKNIPGLPAMDDLDVTSQLIPYLQLILYLCAVNADVPTIPAPTTTRENKVLPFKGVRYWDVGTRVGAALRKARDANASGTSTPHTGDRLQPRPHVRRAHYHHYWVGEGRERLELRWIAPVLVGPQLDFPITVHPVED